MTPWVQLQIVSDCIRKTTRRGRGLGMNIAASIRSNMPPSMGAKAFSLKTLGGSIKISGRGIASSVALDPVQEALLSEPCILVDENDQALGQASKRACHEMLPNGTSLLHRAFSLFIFNSRDELLLQQRSSTKITFPDMWTNTCCSHPLAVESEMEEAAAVGVKRAAQRRVNLELGVGGEEAKVEDITFLTRILYAAPSSGAWGEHELDYILTLRSDPQLTPDPEEVKAIEWVERRHLQDFIRETESGGGKFTPWFQLISKNLLPTWWENLDKLKEMEDHGTIHRY